MCPDRIRIVDSYANSLHTQPFNGPLSGTARVGQYQQFTTQQTLEMACVMDRSRQKYDCDTLFDAIGLRCCQAILSS